METLTQILDFYLLGSMISVVTFIILMGMKPQTANTVSWDIKLLAIALQALLSWYSVLLFVGQVIKKVSK